MKFLTVKEVAAQLRLCTRTIRRYLDAGELAYHRVGRNRLVSDEDLAAYLAASRQPTVRERTERAKATLAELPSDLSEWEAIADRKGL